MGGSPVGLGANREELRRLLGEPTDTSVPTRSQRQPRIWKYGDIEYHFGDDGRVWLIYTEDQEHNPRVLGQLTGAEGAGSWDAAKQRFPAGRVVHGIVTAHRPFGIFVDLGDPVAYGLVQITEFLDSGRMTPERYPALGETVTAVVLGHTDEGRKQVWLCMRPSILGRQAEPPAAPDPAT
jgi:hypothetical protein